MIGSLIAYDTNGDVVATLDYVVRYDDSPERRPLGLVDFASHEASGGRLRDIWHVSSAVGSGVWPEWLGVRVYDFRVELESGTKRIAALVHKQSGYRRERASVEAAIEQRIAEARGGHPADIRDLVGGPERPLILDENGRGKPRAVLVRKSLPLVRVGLDKRDDVE